MEKGFLSFSFPLEHKQIKKRTKQKIISIIMTNTIVRLGKYVSNQDFYLSKSKLNLREEREREKGAKGTMKKNFKDKNKIFLPIENFIFFSLSLSLNI